MPPSVRAIAEYAGVSKSTVSLVLNHKAGVSEAMRQTIFAAVAELEARASQMPKERESRPTETTLSIVVLHPPVLRSSHVFSEVLQGIQAGAESNHLALRLVANEANPSAQHVAKLYFSEPELRPDGVIIFGAKQHEPLIDEARILGIPVVVLGRDAGKYAVSGVGRQEDFHAYQATNHLLELGHRAIGFVGGDATYDYVRNRSKGYQRALLGAGIEPENQWVQLGHGGKALESLLQVAPNVTAVLFVNDSYTAEALPVIEKLGLRIPADLSLLSFDDTPIARNYSPPITSVSYRRYEEGQWAVKLLLDQIRHPYIEAVHTLFKAELILRESTAPPSR